jgi:hypothetical protein
MIDYSTEQSARLDIMRYVLKYRPTYRDVDFDDVIKAVDDLTKYVMSGETKTETEEMTEHD